MQPTDRTYLSTAVGAAAMCLAGMMGYVTTAEHMHADDQEGGGGLVSHHPIIINTAVVVAPPAPPSLQPPPTYWCTWQAQSRMWMNAAGNLSDFDAEEYWMKWRQHDPVSPVQGYRGWDAFSNETVVFDNSFARPGWISLFPRTRSDMIFLFDNGWARANAHFSLDTDKFPSFNVGSDTANLKKLADAVKQAGWRGLGVWIPGSQVSDDNLISLKNAGVTLLKVDGGDLDHCTITERARNLAPDLYIEHGGCDDPVCPLNGGLNKSTGRWPWSSALSQAKTLNCSDIFRTYDMVKALSVPEVLDRQYKLLKLSVNFTGSGVLRKFGGSGEHMVTASLGGVIQPMDSNVTGLAISHAFEVYTEGPPGRQRQHRLEEVDRINMWARIAPPFGAGVQPDGNPDKIVADDSEEGVLWDSWTFKLCDDACTLRRNIVNKTVWQGAPGRISRGGLPLPEVTQISESKQQPYVVVTKFPNGPVMISALGRTSSQFGWQEEPTNVTVDLRNGFKEGSPIGVFGTFENLNLLISASFFGSIKSVYASDLLTPNSLTGIDAQFHKSSSTVTIPGITISNIGTSAQSPSSSAAPGMLLVLSI